MQQRKQRKTKKKGGRVGNFYITGENISGSAMTG